MGRSKLAMFAGIWGLACAGEAWASCPDSGWPSERVCQDVNAYFMPGAVALAYFAHGGTWLGGGAEVAPVVWSHNTEKFGPGQGMLVFDIGILESDIADAGKMVFYRLGPRLSFERNASRAFGIPFFGLYSGGMHEEALGDVGFVEAAAGVHAVFLKNVVVNLEGGYLFPFEAVDTLAGLRATVAVSFTLW